VPREPLVSVLINSYNYARFLPACIDSVLRQTYPAIEVVIVDDGSTDESPAIIRGYGGAVRPVLKRNGGQASAFNAGFGMARGEIVCLLDADDMFVPEKVGRVVEHFSLRPKAEWCFHRLQAVDEAGSPIAALPRAPRVSFPDHREAVARGRISYVAPATTGLCFRRGLLARILPMPEAPGVLLHDNYIKFAALALAPGIDTDECLALQRLHGANAYTGRGRWHQGRIAVRTAYWLRRRYPELERFSRVLLAGGLGSLAATGGADPETRQLAAEFLAGLPPWQRIGVRLRAEGQRLRVRQERPWRRGADDGARAEAISRAGD